MKANPIRVLVTGSAGRIGHAVAMELHRRGNVVTGYDRNERHAQPFRQAVGSITDKSALLTAMQGIDVVVHMAACPDEADFVDTLLPTNVLGVYAVMEAIRESQSVKRLVQASSGKIFYGYTKLDPITTKTPPAPRDWYSATKLFAEAAAEALAYDEELMFDRRVQVVVCRFGWCPRTNEDIDAMVENMAPENIKSEHGGNTYLSPRDAGNFGAACVEAVLPVDFKYEVLNCQSKTQAGYEPRFDTSRSTELVGYLPLDTFPEGTDIVRNDSQYKVDPDLYERIPPPML